MNITRKTMLRFKNSLISEEKSPATIEKYLRDAGALRCSRAAESLQKKPSWRTKSS